MPLECEPCPWKDRPTLTTAIPPMAAQVVSCVRQKVHAVSDPVRSSASAITVKPFTSVPQRVAGFVVARHPLDAGGANLLTIQRHDADDDLVAVDMGMVVVLANPGGEAFDLVLAHFPLPCCWLQRVRERLLAPENAVNSILRILITGVVCQFMNDPRELLRTALRHTKQYELARKIGISAQNLCDVLREHREPGEKILEFLGLEKHVTYLPKVRKPTNGRAK